MEGMPVYGPATGDFFSTHLNGRPRCYHEAMSSLFRPTVSLVLTRGRGVRSSAHECTATNRRLVCCY